MLNELLQTLSWVRSLGAKFARVVPVVTSLIIVLTLISQVTTLLAFFMPLKVVILLGSESIPRYFPPALANTDRDALIAWLSVATLGFYLIHLACERLIAIVTVRATGKLLMRSAKLALFERQEQLAERAYGRFSRVLAGLVFTALSLLLLGVYYPAMALLLLGYFLLSAGFFVVVLPRSKSLRNKIDHDLGGTMKIAGGIGFFMAFGLLVVDSVLWSAPSVVIAIVALLLSRQVLNRAVSSVTDIAGLQRKKEKLDAVFFHGKVLREKKNDHRSVWSLLPQRVQGEWLPELLASLGEEVSKDQLAATIWHQTGVPGIVALRLPLQGGDQLLIKLFDQHRTSLGLHEASLLRDMPAARQFPEFLAERKVQGFACMIYRVPDGCSVSRSSEPAVFSNILSGLLCLSPSSNLLKQYQRSYPALWQRFDHDLIAKLELAANAEQRVLLEKFTALLPTFKEGLSALPMTIVNPAIRTDNAWRFGTAAMLLNWWQWRIAPVGAGWWSEKSGLKGLAEAYDNAVIKRPDLAGTSLASLELSAFAFAVMERAQKQRYSDALALVPMLVALLEGRDTAND